MLRTQFVAGVVILAFVVVCIFYGSSSQFKYNDLLTTTTTNKPNQFKSEEIIQRLDALKLMITDNIKKDIIKNEKISYNREKDIEAVEQAVEQKLVAKVVELNNVKVTVKTNVRRIAVICYIPRGDENVRQFIAMLYGAWKYVKDNMHQVERTENFHYIDLVAFCDSSVCPLLHTLCKEFKTGSNVEDTEMNCWAIEQTFESIVPYGPINSFVMFNRTDIHDILKPYEKVLRSDFDVFITPALLTWQPAKKIVFGQGGYCDKFNMDRLKSISAKLGMKHRGVHCLGSTWYGETNIFIELSKKTYEMTGYMWLNEFDPNATGLETIDFKKNRDGEWIRWWRPVSLLYGAELAINDLIEDLTVDYKRKFDTSSCSKENYLTTPHIHCWHDDCAFQKFQFMNQMSVAIGSRDTLPGDIVHRIIENSYPRTYGNMTISEYSTFIAWNSVGKYLKKWFV